MWSDDALEIMQHYVGRWPAKARLVMLHVSLEILVVYVFDLIVVGACCTIAWRMVRVMNAGMRESGMLVDRLVCVSEKE